MSIQNSVNHKAAVNKLFILKDIQSSAIALTISLLLMLLSTQTLANNFALTNNELNKIAQRIYANECNSNPDKLVWWNRGEAFPSLGIGHFIWYPKGIDAPFQQSFPALVKFMQSRQVELPALLRAKPLHAPWPTREAFLQPQNSEQISQLKLFLLHTMDIQAEFIYQRAQQSFDKIIAAAAPAERSELNSRIQQLIAQPGGAYALIDYVNFKGEGLLESERYRGQGWGLYQVLQEMNIDSEQPLAEFQRAAKMVLRRRAHNAERPIEKNNWLPGWEKRLDSYFVKD